MRLLTETETKTICGGKTYKCNGLPKYGMGSTEKCYYSTTSWVKYMQHYFVYHYVGI